jgi:hypothetical protein
MYRSTPLLALVAVLAIASLSFGMPAPSGPGLPSPGCCAPDCCTPAAVVCVPCHRHPVVNLIKTVHNNCAERQACRQAKRVARRAAVCTPAVCAPACCTPANVACVPCHRHPVVNLAKVVHNNCGKRQACRQAKRNCAPVCKPCVPHVKKHHKKHRVKKPCC